MGLIDGPSLLILLCTGIGIGVCGVLGFDPLAMVVGERSERFVFVCVGAAATWQFLRQPWWGDAGESDT